MTWSICVCAASQATQNIEFPKAKYPYFFRLKSISRSNHLISQWNDMLPVLFGSVSSGNFEWTPVLWRKYPHFKSKSYFHITNFLIPQSKHMGKWMRFQYFQFLSHMRQCFWQTPMVTYPGNLVTRFPGYVAVGVWASSINFGLNLHPYFVYASSKDSGVSAHMRRFVWASTACWCDKYWNLVRWPICCRYSKSLKNISNICFHGKISKRFHVNNQQNMCPWKN